MTQVRFDTLKPGDCFTYLDEGIQMRTNLNGHGLQTVHLYPDYCAGELDGLSAGDLVTPRPDITEGIKKLVGGSDGTR